MASEFKEIQSFVFLDFEGSGLRGSKPRITELCLVALHRSALAENKKIYLGRVMDELTLCVNPVKAIPDGVTAITGLDNYNLSCKKDFDLDTVMMLNCFLRRQQKPVCLVAYNGKGYDFGLLKFELQCIGAELIPSVYCVDPLDFFRGENQIPPMYDWSPKKVPQGVLDNNNAFPRTPERSLKRPNGKPRELFPEYSPVKRQATEAKDVTACQRILGILYDDAGPGSPAKSINLDIELDLENSVKEEEILSSLDKDSLEMFLHELDDPSDEEDQLLCEALDEAEEVIKEHHGLSKNKDAQKHFPLKISYRQREVFCRLFGKYPAQEHFAKDDCYSLAQIFQKCADRILPWCDQNAVRFEFVVPLCRPMKRTILGEKIFEATP